MRDIERGIAGSVEETIRLARETGVKTLVSHFVPIVGSEASYEKALAAIEALPSDVDLRFDIYPSLFTMFPIYTYLPPWVQTGGFEVMMSNVKDEWFASRVIKDMPHFDEDEFIVAQAPGNDFFVGKSLREVKHLYGLKDGREALLKLMQALTMRGSVFYKNLNERLVAEALASSRSFIASNAPSFEHGKEKRLKSERTTATFTRFLSMVQEGQLMPLADAIKKITLEPARMFNLAGRGEIKEGNFADLTCFKGDEIRFTVVNGTVAMVGGEFKGMFPGKALRHSAPK